MLLFGESFKQNTATWHDLDYFCIISTNLELGCSTGF